MLDYADLIARLEKRTPMSDYDCSIARADDQPAETSASRVERALVWISAMLGVEGPTRARRL